MNFFLTSLQVILNYCKILTTLVVVKTEIWEKLINVYTLIRACRVEKSSWKNKRVYTFIRDGRVDSRALKDMLRVQEARFSQHWLFKDLNVRSDIQSMQIVTISFCVNWLSSFHMALKTFLCIKFSQSVV